MSSFTTTGTPNSAPRQLKVPRPQPGETEYRSQVRPPLSDDQVKAIDLILQGHSDATIGGMLGYHRNTISRWRLFHPVFRVQLARLRHISSHALADRLRAAADEAINLLTAQLRDPDPRTSYRSACAILRLAGHRNYAPPDDPTDLPTLLNREIRHQAALAGSAEADPTHRLNEYDREIMYENLVHLAYLHPETPEPIIDPDPYSASHDRAGRIPDGPDWSQASPPDNPQPRPECIFGEVVPQASGLHPWTQPPGSGDRTTDAYPQPAAAPQTTTSAPAETQPPVPTPPIKNRHGSKPPIFR